MNPLSQKSLFHNVVLSVTLARLPALASGDGHQLPPGRPGAEHMDALPTCPAATSRTAVTAVSKTRVRMQHGLLAGDHSGSDGHRRCRGAVLLGFIS